jgi:lipopolysaccharide transport system permease protein
MPAGISDLRASLLLLPLLLHLSRTDLLARYRRSILGPLWLTLGTAAGTVGLGLVWSELFKIDRAQFIPSLTVGLILWQLLSGCITEATVAFARQATIVRNLSIPVGIHPLQVVVKHLVNLAHNVPVYVVVALFFDLALTPTTLLALPMLLLVVANLLWIAIVLSVIGARFRDFEFIVAAVMPLLMFLSPVFFRPAALSAAAKVIWLNPLTHFIELVRYPLLGNVPPLWLVGTNVALCLGGWIVALWLFNAKRDNIAYWL